MTMPQHAPGFCWVAVKELELSYCPKARRGPPREGPDPATEGSGPGLLPGRGRARLVIRTSG